MACWESSQDPSNRCRINSDELDVFEATRYFSGYTDVVLVTSNHGYCNGGVPDRHGYRASLQDKETRQPSLRIARESLDVLTTMPQVPVNGAIVRGDHDHLRRDKILRQPSSPGGKIVSFMKSFLNPSSSAKGIVENKVRKTTATRSLNDRDEINLGGWQRRWRSSIGHFWTSSAVPDSKLLPSINGNISSFSYVHPGWKTLPPSNIVGAPWDRSRSLSHHRQAAVSVSIRNEAREELSKWEASYEVKKASNPSNNAVDCDDNDGNESSSSSDLFELPVYDSTRIKRSSMSTISAPSAIIKLHV